MLNCGISGSVNISIFPAQILAGAKLPNFAWHDELKNHLAVGYFYIKG